LAGLALFLWSSRGRFLLLLGFASLLPYAFTWRVTGGAEWRFTMHVYPFLLLAAVWAIHQCGSFVTLMSRGPGVWSPFEQRTFLRRLAATIALAGTLGLLLTELPHRLIWRDLRESGTAHLRTGPGDTRYFTHGWYPPIARQNVTTRYARGTSGFMSLPMIAGRDHRLTLRLAPYHVDSAPSQTVSLSLNGTAIGVLELEWNPTRMGSYEVNVPGELVRRGANVLRLDGSAIHIASRASDPFARDGQAVGFRVWWVNVTRADGDGRR
jgi:hypothetical protein